MAGSFGNNYRDRCWSPSDVSLSPSGGAPAVASFGWGIGTGASGGIGAVGGSASTTYHGSVTYNNGQISTSEAVKTNYQVSYLGSSTRFSTSTNVETSNLTYSTSIGIGFDVGASSGLTSFLGVGYNSNYDTIGIVGSIGGTAAVPGTLGPTASFDTFISFGAIAQVASGNYSSIIGDIAGFFVSEFGYSTFPSSILPGTLYTPENIPTYPALDFIMGTWNPEWCAVGFSSAPQLIDFDSPYSALGGLDSPSEHPHPLGYGGFTSSSPSIDHSSKDDPGYYGGPAYSGYRGQNSPSEMNGKGPGMGAGGSGSSIGGSAQAGSYGNLIDATRYATNDGHTVMQPRV